MAAPAGVAFAWGFAVPVLATASATVGSLVHDSFAGTVPALEIEHERQMRIGCAAASAAAVFEKLVGRVEFAALVALVATGQSSAEAPAVEA